MSKDDKIELPLGPKGGKRTVTVERAIQLLLHRIEILEKQSKEDNWI